MIAPDSCVICGDAKVMRQTAKIAARQWNICETCAGIGATLRIDGALQSVLHCLHLTAMEIEAFVGETDNLNFLMIRWRSRVRVRFGESGYRKTCPCPNCKSTNKHPGAIPDLHKWFGVETETTASTMPFNVLLSMKPTHVLPTRDGSYWRVDDEIAYREARNIIDTAYPGIKPGGLADRAGAKAPRTVS